MIDWNEKKKKQAADISRRENAYFSQMARTND
jgi:hypothetical protein